MISTRPSRPRLMLLLGVPLLLSLTACASPSVAPEPVKCQHPVVDVTTDGGLWKGLLDYHTAIETCNSLNGVNE